MTGTPSVDVARRAHYRRFYETDPPPGEDLVLVLGNCQAESVRLLLDPDERFSVRVPPVFEMDAGDVRLLHALLPRTTRLATQPVRAGYRGLPLGSDEIIARVGAGSRVARFPIVRYTGLHPFHVVAHSRREPSGRTRPMPQPPLTIYHDLRTVAAALERPTSSEPTPEAVRAVAGRSLAELRRREVHTAVTVSSVLARPGPEHMRTVNHPGNEVLMALAGGVAETLSLPSPPDPVRPLLNSVRAPIEPVVAAAWDLDPAVVSSTWTIDGVSVSTNAVADRHLAWYRAHLDVARAVWDRHRETARSLGLR